MGEKEVKREQCKEWGRGGGAWGEEQIGQRNRGLRRWRKRNTEEDGKVDGGGEETRAKSRGRSK